MSVEEQQHAPPMAVDAERSILGAILMDNAVYNQAAETLRAEEFALDSHRRLYLRMAELSDKSQPIDIITLADSLERSKDLHAVGGVGYIASLTDGLPRAGNIEHHIRIVKDKATMRQLLAAAGATIGAVQDGCETPAEILDFSQSALFKLADARAQRGFMTVPQIVKESFGSIDAIVARGHRITGLRTGFEQIDALTSGLQPSDLVVIAARPSMGKTAIALNIAEDAAVRDEKVVAVFSLEMSREALLLRLLCSNARVDSHKLRTGFLSSEDQQALMRALERLAVAKLFIDDTAGMTLQEMRAKARRLRAREGKLDMVVVDYLQLMEAGTGRGGRQENRTQEVSAISRGLKALAKEVNAPVIALSQLNRAPDTRGAGDHRPQLSDLRESGSIEQDADVVMFIYRPEVYERDRPELEGRAEVIIAKQRNGPTGTAHLAFIKRSTRFENAA